jgi:hypothetical protein
MCASLDAAAMEPRWRAPSECGAAGRRTEAAGAAMSSNARHLNAIEPKSGRSQQNSLDEDERRVTLALWPTSRSARFSSDRAISK